MTISYDEASFAESLKELRDARSAVGSVKMKKPERSSKSKVLDAFDERLAELKKIVKQYESLIENDVDVLANIGVEMGMADAMAAHAFTSEIRNVFSAFSDTSDSSSS